MKKNKKTLTSYTEYIVVFIILVIISLAIYNICANNKFFETSASTCISLLLVVGISFFIVQKQTDDRRQKELFIKLLESLQNLVDNEKNYELQGLEKEEILMKKREISNKLTLVNKCGEKWDIQEDIQFLEEKYKEYETIIGDHINSDFETLSLLHNELKRPLLLISQRLVEIMFKLYN